MDIFNEFNREIWPKWVSRSRFSILRQTPGPALLRLFVAAVLLLLSACSGDPGTGPVEVKWDRTTCERCRMILSDRHFSSEVRVHPRGKKRSRVHFFDDIGCAVLWLEGPGKEWVYDPKTEIWTKDYRNGNWIDARTATYVEGKITPMEYGLGAQADPAPDGMDFTAAKQRIHEVEERFNIHGVQLLERLREQQARRETLPGSTTATDNRPQ